MPTLQLAIDSRRAKEGADVFVRATDGVTKSSKRVDQALRQNRDEMGRFAGEAQSTASSVRNAFAGIFAGLAGGYAVKEAFNQVAAFEQRLAEIQGVTEGTAEQMLTLERAARGLGVASQFSASQAAESMLNLAKAGFTVKESVASVDEVLALAQAHGLDLGFAAEILIASMRTFGLTTEEATRIIDSFSATANLSSSDVDDLAKSLEFAGPFANSLGLELEEVNAALGVLSNVMIRGAKGGTAIRAILEGLANPSSIARQEFEKMGVAAEDLDPQIHSLADIFTLLRERQMSAIQAVRIFGVEAASSALTLANNAEVIDTYIQKQKEMTGSTTKLAKIMSETPLGALGKLMAAIREITLSIGRDSGLSGAFVTAANFLRDSLIVAFTEFDQVITSNRATVEQFVRVMEALAVGVIARTAVPALGLLASQVGTVTAAVKALTLAMAANPIGLLLTAISAGVATLVYFRNSMIEMGDKSFTVMDLLTASWEHFVEVLKFAGSTVRQLWNSVLLPVLELMKEGFLASFRSIGEGIEVVLEYFETDWKTAIRDTVNFSIASFMTMKDAFQVVFDTITSGVTAIASIDWTDRNSVAAGAIALVNAFNPERIGKELATRTEDNFAKDWVQGLKDSAREGWNEFLATWNAFAATDVGRELDSLFNPVTVFQSITDRADALRRQREEVLAGADAETALATAVRETTQEIIDAEAATEGLTKEQTNAIARLKEMTADLQFERTLIGQTVAEQERLNMVRQAEVIIQEGRIENGQEYLDILEQELFLLQQARGNAWYEEYLRNVLSDIELVNMSNDQRQIAIALREAERFGIENNVQDMEKYLSVLERELTLLQKMGQIKQLADNIGDSFSNALGDVVVGAKNANEALKDLLMTVYRLVFNEIVGRPLASAVSSGLFSLFGGLFTPAARGAVADNGSVTPMAAGGLISAPTRVPMANGSALMGEQGPEAVFPLTRLADGRLGLSADMGDQAKTTVVNINITAKDVDSFRRSKHQIASELSRVVNRAQGTA